MKLFRHLFNHTTELQQQNSQNHHGHAHVRDDGHRHRRHHGDAHRDDFRGEICGFAISSFSLAERHSQNHIWQGATHLRGAHHFYRAFNAAY